MPLLTVVSSSASPEPERPGSAGAAPTMRIELSPRLVMLVLGPNAPSHADWRASMASIELSIACGVPMVIVSHGGSPTALQSQLLGLRLARTRVALAIVSDHDGLVAALDWARGAPVFAMSGLEDALAYLGMTSELWCSMKRRVEVMYRDIVGAAPERPAVARYEPARPASAPPSSGWRRRRSPLPAEDASLVAGLWDQRAAGAGRR